MLGFVDSDAPVGAHLFLRHEGGRDSKHGDDDTRPLNERTGQLSDRLDSHQCDHRAQDTDDEGDHEEDAGPRLD